MDRHLRELTSSNLPLEVGEVDVDALIARVEDLLESAGLDWLDEPWVTFDDESVPPYGSNRLWLEGALRRLRRATELLAAGDERGAAELRAQAIDVVDAVGSGDLDWLEADDFASVFPGATRPAPRRMNPSRGNWVRSTCTPSRTARVRRARARERRATRRTSRRGSPGRQDDDPSSDLAPGSRAR